MDNFGIEEFYNLRGFNKDGIHKVTGTKYNPEGYDAYGYDKDGFNEVAYHKDTHTLYDPEGYTRKGFNKDGIHKLTGTIYDPDGFDKLGHDKNGFRRSGSNTITGTNYDVNGYDVRGFNKEGIHRDTNSKYDPDGFDRTGHDAYGFNRDGVNKLGFRKDGFNVKTNSLYDQKGYDIDGYDSKGFNKDGIHKVTKTKYDESGKNIKGISKQDIEDEKTKLLMIAKDIADGNITVSRFLDISDKSAKDMFEIAKANFSLDKKQYINFKEFMNEFKLYQASFDEKKFLETTKYIVDGNIVAPTKEDIEICKQYLIDNDTHLCDYTIRKTVREYIQGILVIDKNKEKKKIK